MDIRWKILIVRLFAWALAEFILTLIGIDDMADYSEFLADKHHSYLQILG